MNSDVRARSMRLALLASLVLSTFALAAQAEEPDALTLFEKGRKLMENNNTLGEACSTLETSYKLALRGDTLLNLAECHRRQGKTATAWAEFDKALSIGKKVGFTEAQQVASQLRDELAKKLSALTVTVSPETAALAGLDVQLNGKPLPRDQWNKRTIIDPGPMEVVAAAKGYKRFNQRVELTADKDEKVIAIAMEREPPPPVPAPPPPAPPKPVVTKAPAPKWPWIVGAAGVGLAGASIGFLIDSAAARKKLDENCGDSRQACPPGYDFGPARSRELRSFGLFVGLGVGGVVAVGAAGIGLGLSSRPSGAKTSLSLTPTSVALQGTF